MEKSNNSSGDVEDCEPPNFKLKFFFSGPPPKRFSNLSEQESNQLFEQSHSEMDQNNNKLVCINLSKLVMHKQEF